MTSLLNMFIGQLAWWVGGKWLKDHFVSGFNKSLPYLFYLFITLFEVGIHQLTLTLTL